MKNYFKLLSGLAGELEVAKILCLKGYVPTLAPTNCPTFDIFCFDPDAKKQIVIQVKTIRDEKGKVKNSYPIISNRDKREEFYSEIAGPFVFVHIDINGYFKFYILSKEQFINISSKVETDYDNLPREKPIQEGSPMAMPKKHLVEFENNWDNLWL